MCVGCSKDKLLEGLNEIDWPESTKEIQRNWIGKSVGAHINFKIAEMENLSFTVFTTRCDTLFGATYCVLAPEHELVDQLVTPDQQNAVKKYRDEIKSKSDLERTDLNKDKTGVFTGSYAINPINGEKLPIWIADYVLTSYGTGIVMAVPAHDERDYEFATKFNLPIKKVIDGKGEKLPYTGDGLHINSDFLNGLNKEDAINKAIVWLQDNEYGYKKVNYRLRDWIFSRQRYWGEPIPVIHWDDGETTLVPEKDLPLTLPDTDNLTPSGTGESPLANIDDWVNVVDENGRHGKRETNTMPQWAGSSWYYLRYIDPNNDDKLADKDKLKKWLPVDLYIGGAEHAVLHLLYARFWHKVLYDLGIVPTKEPFQKLVNQGMILGENHEKMSKSKGNVINPDDIVNQYGADTLRLYEMFMGPLEESKPWNEEGINGIYKWINRVWRLCINENGNLQNNIVDNNDHKLDKVYNQTVKKVTEDYEKMHFNTAISQMMVFINDAYKVKQISTEYVQGFIKLLSPLAPHVCEEIWSKFNLSSTIAYEKWPEYDATKLVENTVEVVIQINGKLRSKIEVDKDLDKNKLQDLALNDEKIKTLISGKDIRKVIVVPNKIVNIVC